MAKQAKPKAEPTIPAQPKTAPITGAPEMKAAWDLFDAGDNRAARKLTKKLLETGSASPAAQAEAHDLLTRIGYDRGAALSVLGITAAVTFILVMLVVAHKFG